MDGIFATPRPANEPVLGHAPGSSERASLQAEVDRQASDVVEIPCVVDGKRIHTGNVVEVTMPCDHGHVLARAHLATPELLQQAVKSGLEARKDWSALPWQERAAILLRAADLLAGSWRDRMNASTMLGQAKTCHQAEIDAACELIDFFRFNVGYARQILSEQPGSNPGCWNRLDHRGLEGFVLAITPFNFSSIAGNLPTAPALMGNVCLWKPATTQLHNAWVCHELLEEAGMPPGVINFIPGRGRDVGKVLLPHPDLAGIHFTGSTGTFQHMWSTVGANIAGYRGYPRIVGETGGKDFILAHPSADAEALAVAIARGGFEYQGQKCSAASRIYVPQSLWPQVSEHVAAILAQFRMGDVRDFSNFVGAVIDQSAWRDHTEYLGIAHETGKVLCGGESDDSTGWFV
ncbi:MAG: aldehyde dehydrogenase family protein, partial [Myxococcota bacterium]|nr:aldehyde dehydrogenase family protein [Myxococcota bacterium]